jgi:hypothetical protein
MYYKIHAHDRIIVIKQDVVGEYDSSEVRKLEDAAQKYAKKRRIYQIDAKISRGEDSIQRVVAGLILHFSAFQKFTSKDVLSWAAFANEDLNLQRVGGAISGKALKQIVRSVGKTYWVASEADLRKYLKSPR